MSDANNDFPTCAPVVTKRGITVPTICVRTKAKFAVFVLNKEENPQVENPQIEAVDSKNAHPNCTVLIRNCKRTYCSNHHNKSEHFKRRLDFYTSCHDHFGVHLCTILLPENKRHNHHKHHHQQQQQQKYPSPTEVRRRNADNESRMTRKRTNTKKLIDIRCISLRSR